MLTTKHIFSSLLLGLIAPGFVLAQDISRLGGDLTSDRPIDSALELPAPNIRSDEMFDFHLIGHGDFHRTFRGEKLNGKVVLGPNFNHDSCAGCHVKNGKGAIKFSKNSIGSPMLVKVSQRGLKSDGTPKDVKGVGEQLQDHTVGGKNRFNITLTWQLKSGRYPDGTRYTLRKPILDFDIPKVDMKKIVSSLRMTPTVIGVGLLEAVPAETIEAMSDPFDLDGDGISGRVNYVLDKETNTKAVGRFGFRATHPTVRQQSAAAFFFDMGLTSELFQSSKQQQEISTEVLDRTVFYLQAAGVTPARDQDNPDVIAGKQLFQQINCDSCHKMTLHTGDSEVQEVANQEFHPFTDLLLHDMGSGLADKRPEFSASGREWRTTPLWGLGISKVLAKHKPGFLHDGRARTIEEAILWHGGEAESIRNQFKALSKTQRQQLLRFLESL